MESDSGKKSQSLIFVCERASASVCLFVATNSITHNRSIHHHDCKFLLLSKLNNSVELMVEQLDDDDIDAADDRINACMHGLCETNEK